MMGDDASSVTAEEFATWLTPRNAVLRVSQAIIGNEAPRPTPAAESDFKQAEPEAKAPSVSDQLLKEWYELYQKAYQGSADTLQKALESARGMFPGKFVSRDRVRKLCEGRKRGRKSGEPPT
jgi:hypothetical protein